MPHSSGGGSHGGGSHGGHGGSHSSSSRTRTSSRPFHNSRRYVYYHRNQPRYFYAGSDFKPGFSFATVFAISHLPLSLSITTTGKIPTLHWKTIHTTGIFPNSMTKCTGS